MNTQVCIRRILAAFYI